jgi:Raf kinase inhibitor-like YbhB/YbcL family protein
MVLAACGGDDDDTSAATPPPDASEASSDSTVDENAEFTLTSTAFEDGDPIPPQFTCDGQNTSPQLAWSGVPDGTEQLALIVDDPDAPSGNFVHWVMWGFAPADTPIAAGKVPRTAIQGQHGAGGEGYTGPCPPSGVHNYVFQLFALSSAPQVPPGADDQQLRDAIADITIGEATLTGTYTRE